jgi:ABC-type branched-subunit amino acid transport system ATPase component/ABC-type branched-subunit amino acid transport system permease subunit
VILLSIVVLTGYAGQISLAQYALAGLGAYVAGRLVATTDISFLPAAVIGIAAAVPIGAIFAVPAVRTRGVNLAVITLGLGVAITTLVFSNADYTGGLAGTNIGALSIFGFSLNSVSHPERYAVLVLTVFAAAAVMVANLRRGAPGRRLIAIRGNERAAASLGISVARTKIYAFIVAATLAAVGGILIAYRSESVVFANFDPLQSIYAVAFTVIGGLGYVFGPILGATLVAGGIGSLFEELIPGLGEYLPLIGGVTLLVTLLVNPDGIVPGNIRIVKPLLARADLGRAAARLTHRLPLRRRPRPSVLVRSDDPVGVDPRPLAVEGLTVRFGAVTAVSDLSLSVAPGEIVGLIGPNGAGKTTFIDAVTGFVAPDSGTISLAGRPVTRMSADARVGAGMARTWQSLELFEDVSVLENLLVAAESDGHRWWDGLTGLLRPGRPRLAGAAAAAVAEFGFEEDLARLPSDLSYGRRRLAAIARSVALRPSVLLLDEPAAGLTSEESLELGRLLSRLARSWGMGLVLVEHDVDLVMGICDRVVVMNFGAVIATGTPRAVQEDQRVIDAYLGSDEDEDHGAVPAAPHLDRGAGG